VTMLELLEHLAIPQADLKDAMNGGNAVVVLSMPWWLTDNPEHIQLFSPDQLRQWPPKRDLHE